MKIGNIETKNNVFLAPMAGVTDLVFRVICKEMDCGMVYSEMVSAKGVQHNNKNTKELLKVDERERPVAMQMFGSDPEIMAEMARKLNEYEDIDILDINMGCPAPKIVKNGEGSALTLNPKLVGEIISAVSKASEKPVTVKFRKGFDDQHLNALEIGRIAEESGAKAVTIHGRTREQYYSGKADWEIIRQVKEAVKIPVIGNGDVTSARLAADMRKQTGCDGVMIGRGAQGNPWIFHELLVYEETGQIPERPNIQQICDTILRHARLQIEFKGEYLGIREMRKHTAWYTKGMTGSARLRDMVNQVETYEELEALLTKMITGNN